MEGNEVPPLQAHRALERVLASSAFTGSQRLSGFLRYTVEQTLAGNPDVVKEYTIGTIAYGRKSDFDPSQDTIVRTEARRLRRKLKEYYEGDGRYDDVVIFFRTGSYVPVIHWRNTVEGADSSTGQPNHPAASELWKQGDGVWVMVAPLSSENGDTIAASFAFGLREEILHRLTGTRGIRVIVGDFARSSASGSLETETAKLRDGVQIVIGGTVRCDQNRLVATIRIAIANGLVLWSQRFDASIEQTALVKLQGAIAATWLSRIAPREMVVQQFAGTPTDALFKLYSEVLEAEALIEESSHAAITAALKKLEQLKVKAPDYARLNCDMAQCYVALAQRGGYPADAFVDRANAIARELLSKYPELPEAHSIQAMAFAQKWNWEAAEESFRTALSLGSQHSIHRQFAVFLMTLGRMDESWEHLQIAREMDPFSIRQKVSMARFFYYSRRHEEGASYYLEVAAYGELPLEPAYYQAMTLIAMDRSDEALLIAERLQKSAGSTLPYLSAVAELYALCGAKSRAEALVTQRGLLDPASAYSSFRKARLGIALDETSAVMEFLKESLGRREPELPLLAIDPRFDPVRDHDVVAEIATAIFPAMDAPPVL